MFGEVVHRAQSQALDRNLHLGDGGDHHHRHIWMAQPHLAQQLLPVHPRHAKIGEDEHHALALEQRQRLGARACLEALEALALHEAHDGLTEARLIVDNQAAEPIAVRSGGDGTCRWMEDGSHWMHRMVMAVSPRCHAPVIFPAFPIPTQRHRCRV